jgi:hypothetical protein
MLADVGHIVVVDDNLTAIGDQIFDGSQYTNQAGLKQNRA